MKQISDRSNGGYSNWSRNNILDVGGCLCHCLQLVSILSFMVECRPHFSVRPDLCIL